MITIIHGDDIVTSRKFLNEERAKKKSALSFTNTYSVTDIAQALEGSLFENDTTIFIENLLTRKKSKEKDEIITYIAKEGIQSAIYLWEDAEVPQKTIQVFTQAQSRLFKLPKLLFTFLESLAPKKGNELVLLFHQILEQSDADFIFAMIIRQFRLLLAVSDANAIDEIKRLAPWQTSKLNKQRSFFTDTQLLSNYKKLLTIDTSLKTGALSLSLAQAIDFFLIDLYH